MAIAKSTAWQRAAGPCSAKRDSRALTCCFRRYDWPAERLNSSHRERASLASLVSIPGGHVNSSPLGELSSLLFSSLVALLLRCERNTLRTRVLAMRVDASARRLALSELCRSKFGILKTPRNSSNQPTELMAKLNPKQFESSSKNARVTAGCAPSVVLASNHSQIAIRRPTTSSLGIPSCCEIASTSGLLASPCSILIQAMMERPLCEGECLPDGFHAAKRDKS